MSTTAKIIIGVIVGAMLTCLAIGVLGFVFFRSATNALVNDVLDTNPNEVIRVGSEIAEYEVPDGFPNAVSSEFAGFRMISYTGSDDHSHIYFFQLPEGVTVDVSDMEMEMKTTFPANENEYVQMEVVDTQKGTIAGQEVTLLISEGSNHDGEAYRQVSAVFQGKGGQAMVIFSRPTASWDQTEVDDFLASIR